jgi:broad specificity phosphatase PhoE
LPTLRPWVWGTPQQLGAWLRAYNHADVVMHDMPVATLNRAKASAVVITSPSRRCIQSAQALCPQRPFLTDPVFREVGPPHVSVDFPKLPILVWAHILHLAWSCGLSVNTELKSQAAVRARAAATTLIDLAQRHGSVFLVSHGMISLLIARQLLAWGWLGPRRPFTFNDYWKFAVYSRRLTRA